ncbi:MAG: DMT family transporter [Rhodospirillales bacterium]|nr:DMT family transporter [Rhodospirillales bacterium]
MNSELPAGDHNLAGIGYILLGVGFLATMDSVAKALVGAEYSVMQILAIRGWIIVCAMLLMLPKAGGFAALKTRQPVKHLFRVSVGFGAPYFFFSSLKVLGLADATVIFFGGGTFLMTALSALLFKERVGPHRWGAVAVGFIGVVIAAQPSSDVFQVEALYPIAAGVCYAAMVLATRWLGPAEGAFKPVFYFNLGVACFASLALPSVYRAMPAGDITTILVMAGLAVSGHFCITRAFHTAPVGLLAPFEFTALIWAAGLGYFIWSDVPANNVLMGAAIIVASGIYLIHREALAARRQKTAPETLIVTDPLVVAVPIAVEKTAEK